MSHGKQFTLYSHQGGPNGWKVAIVLEELGLTYETIYLDFNAGENKSPEFTSKYNPNGRIPVIVDHKNNDFILWESGAVITYLVEKYDPEHKVSVGGEEKYKQLQWLFFQASGQGPYFGQAAWFTYFHAEKVPSAVERYQKEIKRVWSVLESVLSKEEWLVGGKPTVADLSFITWNDAGLKLVPEGFNFGEEFPAVARWHAKLAERPSVKKYHETKAAVSKH